MMRFPTPHCWHPLYVGKAGDLPLYQFSPTKFRWGQYKKGKLFSYYLSPSNCIFLYWDIRQIMNSPAEQVKRYPGPRPVSSSTILQGEPAGPTSAFPAKQLYTPPLLLRRVPSRGGLQTALWRKAAGKTRFGCSASSPRSSNSLRVRSTAAPSRVTSVWAGRSAAYRIHRVFPGPWYGWYSYSATMFLSCSTMRSASSSLHSIIIILGIVALLSQH